MIEYLEHHLVDHCNCNCAGCSHFSPLADPWFENLEDFKRDFKKLSEMTEVQLIRLMGGEPLLHPQVGDFLKITRELFPKSQIQLVTNGLLLKKRKEELLPICNDNNIIISISDYQLVPDLENVLNGFKYTRIDRRKFMYNLCLDVTGSQNSKTAYNRCEMRAWKCYYFQNGRFYLCAVCANINYFNKAFNNPIKDCDIENMSISIYNHSIEEIRDFLNTPVDFCKYCMTDMRFTTFHPFYHSKKEIQEWTLNK